MKVLLHCGSDIIEMGITPEGDQPPQDIPLSMFLLGRPHLQHFILTGKADGLPIYHPQRGKTI